MINVETTALGLSVVRFVVDQKPLQPDFYCATNLPRALDAGLLRVEQQSTIYNCAASNVVTMARLQNKVVSEDEASEAIGITYNGADPEQVNAGMKKLGLTAWHVENMSVEYLKALLRSGKYVVLIDIQEPECDIGEKLSGDAGHYELAIGLDEFGFILFGESAYEGFSRIHETELQYLWYDVSLATGKWFFGSGIVAPITYRRKTYPCR